MTYGLAYYEKNIAPQTLAQINNLITREKTTSGGGDDNGGDACDPCDNANIYVVGNTYGDYFIYDDDIELSYQVNIFDVFRLLEIVENNDQENCGYEAGDLTGEGEVNIFDAYALLGLIMDGII